MWKIKTPAATTAASRNVSNPRMNQAARPLVRRLRNAERVDERGCKSFQKAHSLILRA
jgi:hypothetical protein